MKHIEDYYKEYFGDSVTSNSCHHVHDSLEVIAFADWYSLHKIEDLEIERFKNTNSVGKATNECLFCKSRFCYERVVSQDMSYDEVACAKHVKDLYKHSDIVAAGKIRSFISGTSIQKRMSKF